MRSDVDGPLWVADPTIDAVAATVLPPALGGGTDGNQEVNGPGDGAVIDFRDKVLCKATQAVRTPVRDTQVKKKPAAQHRAPTVRPISSALKTIRAGVKTEVKKLTESLKKAAEPKGRHGLISHHG